jgi:homoserine kinase
MRLTPLSTVAVRIPGTTANLGPGFDALGVALRLYNVVRVTRVDGSAVAITSPIAEEARAGAVTMLADAADLFFSLTDHRHFGVNVSLTGDVPIARGLGSSVTARLGLVAALNELTRAKLDRQALLEIVTELEHHPDNAAPALFGGFTVAGMVEDAVRCCAVPVSARLKFVALIPRFEVSTEKARQLVPSTFSKADTVHSLNRAALLSAAFMTENYPALRGLFDDRLHQPYRQKLIPALFKVIAAGERAGALGGWLSGSGSTIMCVTLDRPESVARAMRRELPNSEVKVLTADNHGLRVLRKGR